MQWETLNENIIDYNSTNNLKIIYFNCLRNA